MNAHGEITGGTGMTQFMRLFIALAAFVPLLQGCDEPIGAQNQPANGAKPAEVRLGYFANVTHAQALLGVDSGEFQQAISPVKLTTKIFNAGPSLVEALFAGEIDIGYVGPSPALSAYEKSRGEGIRVIAGAAANGVVIVARPDSGINSMADLAGKRIATPQLGNTQDIAARHYLTHILKQPNADNVLPVPNGEQAATMARGQIDAAWAPEPWGARLEKEAGAKLIAEEKDFWPDKEFVLTVVVARPEFLSQHPDLVAKLLTVHTSWTARLQSAPQAQVPALQSAMRELTNKTLDASAIEAAIARVKFTDEPLKETFDTFAQWALDLGFSKSRPDLTNLTDTTILRKVQASNRSGTLSTGAAP